MADDAACGNDMEQSLRFAPSRVKGLLDVTEVAVFPDRLEVCSAGKWLSFPFKELIEWHRPAWFWRLLARLGWRRRFLPVGEQDWFHPLTERFFRFFTCPRIVVYMPAEPDETKYPETLFHRIQNVIMRGGFNSWDLG